MPTASVSAARPATLERLARITPPVAAFLAGAGPVVLLGFSRGGYPVEVVAGYGVALWWLLLVGFLTDALPRPRPTTAGWVALVAVIGLAAWGALSLGWTADRERGLTEVVRFVVAGGSLLLGMSAARAGQARALAGGVFAGLSAIVVLAVLSRLFPELVPSAGQTGEFLESARRRVAWPLNYWNAVAAAAAMALPLGLVLAARARSAVTGALCVAPIPALVLGLAYTLSRGGMGAAALGVVVALLVVAPRPVVLRTVVAPGVGSFILLLAGLRPEALTDVLGGAAQEEAGRQVFVVLLVASVGAALVQAAFASADEARWTPRLPRPRPRRAAGLVAIGVVGVLAVGVALDVPGRAADGWDRFRDPDVPTAVSTTNDAGRLSSISGNGRYQMWSGAIDALQQHELRGLGLGSWESWWNTQPTRFGFVRNAHSEPFELLAETGLVGGVLFALLLLTPVVAGGTAAVRRRLARRDGVLAVPALVAFVVALMIDWNWQIGALMVAGMTLAAIPLTRADDDEPVAGGRRWPAGQRVAAGAGIAVLSVAAIAALSLALVAPQAVNASREAAQQGDLATAAAQAAKGEAAASFAATPSLQRALVEEQAGRLAAAEAAGRRAAARTPEDWRPWFLVARVAAARGRDAAAVAAFRRARRLNPQSPLLRP
jgi:hypothetical protein